MTFGRSAVTASRPAPRLAASTTALRAAFDADRYTLSAAEYSSASCRRKISLTVAMRSSTFTSVSLSWISFAIACIAEVAPRIRWFAQITVLMPASRKTSVGVL